MQVCNHGPMLGLRSPWSHNRFAGAHRVAKLADRRQLATDIDADRIAIEAITTHAITPRMYEDAATEWSDELRTSAEWWDAITDLDVSLEGEFADDIDDDGPFEGREPLDTDDLPGWGTHLAWEDLATLTITNRPYGFSGYGQRDR